MHITFLTPEYSREDKPEGGLANYLRKVSLELVNRGHKVTIFCLSPVEKHWVDLGIEVFEIRRVVYPYQLKRFKLVALFLPVLAQIRSSRRLERSLWKYHKLFPIDIIQASSYKSPGFTLRSNKTIPVICRVSSYAPMIRSAENRRRGFAEYLCDWLEIRQVVDVQAAFAPSRLMADAYARLEGCRPSVIHTPIESVDVPLDESFYNKQLHGKRYLLCFGTLKLVKGIDLLADIITPILEKHAGLHFVFIGRDDGMNSGQKIFKVIRSKNMKFEKQLIYHPALLKSSLYPVIKNAIGVLMPSRMDNYPNSCLEALTLGVPVIGTTQSSLDEMIVDGKTGFLAANGDSTSIQIAIERLLALSNEQRNQMQIEIKKNIQMIIAEDRVGQLIRFYEDNIKIFQDNRKKK